MGQLLAADGYPASALRLTDADITKYSLELVDLITATGQQFDFMGIVPRGSYGPGNIISRRFGFTAPYLVHFCMSWYPDGAIKIGEVSEEGQMPPYDMLKGKDIIIIEEVCHTGITLQGIKKYCEVAGVNSVRFATLFLKPKQSKFKPDFWVKETEEWIVFPWELHEKAGKKSTVRRRTTKELARDNTLLTSEKTPVHLVDAD